MATKAKNVVELRQATTHIVESTLKKQTPGTYVYENTDDGCVIPSLYVKKFAFPNGAPKAIKITVEVID